MTPSTTFLWKSPLMEIVSAEERVSKSTEKPYVVVKARMVFLSNPRYLAHVAGAKKVYSMMCFKESLFALFQTGNHHEFEGELSFDWGNTWLKITKLFDDKGNRLLRPYKTNCQDDTERDRVALAKKLDDKNNLEELEREQAEDFFAFCAYKCDECQNIDCVDCPFN